MSYVSPKKAAEHFKVTTQTLRRWAKQKKIKTIVTNGGHRRYYVENKGKFEENQDDKIIYARVSSKKQEKDLQRQVKYLQTKYPKYRIITDIGSGINFKRKGLNSILEGVFNRDIEEVVVTHRDRLTRFGFEHFDYIFKRFGSTLTVMDTKQEKSYEEELVDDVVSIISVFTAKHYGSRKYKIRKKNTILSEQRAEIIF